MARIIQDPAICCPWTEDPLSVSGVWAGPSDGVLVQSGDAVWLVRVSGNRVSKSKLLDIPSTCSAFEAAWCKQTGGLRAVCHDCAGTGTFVLRVNESVTFELHMASLNRRRRKFAFYISTNGIRTFVITLVRRDCTICLHPMSIKVNKPTYYTLSLAET